MRKTQASQAKAVAVVIPEAKRRQSEIDEAIAKIRALRQRTGKVTTEELLSFRHEGHKY
jgi:hypothetical protein